MRFSCPQCGAEYDIKDESRLSEAGGKVSCFRCGKVFTVPAIAERLSGGTQARDELAETAKKNRLRIPSEKARPGQPKDSAATQRDSTGETRGTRPSLALEEPVADARPLASLAWGLGSLALMLILGVQGLWHLRADPEIHRLLSRTCETAGCEVPPLRDLESIALIDRVFTRDPDYPDLLVLRLRFINNAGFAQPYPGVELILLDTTQAAVGKSRVTPGDYSGQSSRTGTLQPGEFGEIELGVLDPGQAASGFAIEFF